MTTLQLKQAIRAKYAWPGGYALMFITSDGAALCADCTRAEFRQVIYSIRHRLSDGWRVEGIQSAETCEESETCDHCGEVFE